MTCRASLAPAAQIVAGMQSLSERMQDALRSVDAISFRRERMKAYAAAGIDLSRHSEADVSAADNGALWATLNERCGVIV
jgi:hypothetical protein